MNSSAADVGDWAARLLENPDLTRMGHLQRVEDANLGLGWIYYALARVIRTRTIVVIGSYRGFVPLVFARALTDNLEGGRVVFIDPSLVDDFWKDPKAVREYFSGFDANNIEHFLGTTQEFARSEAYRSLERVGIVFIDGYHSEEQARFDYETFKDRLGADGVTLFHDSARCHISRIYGPDRPYECRVKCFIDQLRLDASVEVFDLPFDQGVTMVRRRDLRDTETTGETSR